MSTDAMDVARGLAKLLDAQEAVSSARISEYASDYTWCNVKVEFEHGLSCVLVVGEVRDGKPGA